MKLRKVFNMKNQRVKYNVNFLKDKATKDQFNITLSNKFQILEELDKKSGSHQKLLEKCRRENRRKVQLIAAELGKKRQQLKH